MENVIPEQAQTYNKVAHRGNVIQNRNKMASRIALSAA